MPAPVYLDHAASSPLRVEARDALVSHLSLEGNPSALHVAGQRARRALEEAREELAGAVGAAPGDVVFTSGGSEADSIALVGGMAARHPQGRTRCLVSAVEHPAVLGMLQRGADAIAVGRDGAIDVDQALAALDGDVGVVSVMAVNNETGIRQGLAELVAAAEEYGAWVHTDAVQALGHVPVDFRGSGVDMMSLSAHKVGGPVGIGALLVRRSVTPAMVGLGGGQERDIRSGTGAVALAAAFAAAAVAATQSLAEEARRLRGFQTRIMTACRVLDGVVNTTTGQQAPHITNVTFAGVRANDLLFLLDQRGVYASVGSACRAGLHQPSEVLLAMGRTPDEAAGSLRFSTGHSTTDADIARLEEVLPAALRQARAAF